MCARAHFYPPTTAVQIASNTHCLTKTVTNGSEYIAVLRNIEKFPYERETRRGFL